MSNFEQMSDLTFEVLPNGAIELQQGFMEVDRVSLHPCQIRLLFERAGHLLPTPPTDKLVQRLAGQLLNVRDELAAFREHSPNLPPLEILFAKLSAYCDALPDEVVPSDNKLEAAKPDFELTPQTPLKA